MIRYLHDVAGLEPLQQIARNFEVVLAARGGVARRAYAHQLLRPDAPDPDLFDLTPFTSDIDLTHSGDASKTAEIMRAVYAGVPFAECFRWELKAVPEDDLAQRASAYNTIVPLHHVSLSTLTGFEDPLGARGDIVAQNYRYVRNPAYQQSPLYREYRDLEVFGAIRYLRAVLEIDVDELVDQPSGTAVAETFRDAASWDTRMRLQESAYLRTKLHSLLKALGAVTRSPSARSLLEPYGLIAFLTFADADLAGDEQSTLRYDLNDPRLISQGRVRGVPRAPYLADIELGDVFAITESEHLGGDLYRLPSRVPFSLASAAGTANPDSILAGITNAERLAEGIEPLRLSSWIRVVPGRARSSERMDGVDNEMIHFAIIDRDLETSGSPVRDEDLGVLIIVRSAAHSDSVFVAAPLASCTSQPLITNPPSNARVLSFRLACGDLFEQLAGGDRDSIHVAFMIAARRVEEQTGDAVFEKTAKLVDEKEFKIWLKKRAVDLAEYEEERDLTTQ
jgi:hypothetical protein